MNKTMYMNICMYILYIGVMLLNNVHMYKGI